MTSPSYVGLIASARPPSVGAISTSSGLKYIDWTTHFALDHSVGDFLDDGWLARGRSHSLYATHKAGKSLFALARAAELAATGRAAVMYLDFEMTEMDVQERLLSMGYDGSSDLSQLRYALLPTLEPLDSPNGSAELVTAVEALQAEYPSTDVLVVIDTFSRVVEGEENSSDTYRAFARLTGLALKRLGVTVLRLDHTGKDASRGTRGSSAKGDDIDVAWRLERTPANLTLHRELSRMGWIPAKVTYAVSENPLAFTPTQDSPCSAYALEVATRLDRLGIPTTDSTRACMAALKAEGSGRRSAVVAEAQKYRRRNITP